jgi:hypothetical protein
MNTMTRTNIYLPMTALLLAALAIPAAADQQVPFKGTFQGDDAVTPTTITTNGHWSCHRYGTTLINQHHFPQHC